MAEPLVSIVIATRERPELLQRAIRSILRQTLREIEIVVVDDGSSQETRAQYERSMEDGDERVSYHFANEATPQARGVCPARNLGLRRARAPYVVFFDDDDEMTTTDHLEVAVEHHRRRPKCLYFADLRMVKNGQTVLDARLRPVDEPMTKRQLEPGKPVYEATLEEFGKVFTRRYPHLNATVLDVGLTKEIGGFAETLIFCEDLNFFLRYADVASTVLYRRETVVDFDATPRPRMFDAPAPVLRDLMISMALSKARTSIRNRHLLRSSAAIEAHMLAEAAEKLNDAGNGIAARYLALQSLILRVTRNGLRQGWRSLLS
ncbi:MAG TPA: glycosyltransferase family A protein [Bryobacteraceae bacterium]|nr:glycosyltransferase family A protein [Bryobacteraceae bacterium]HPT26784.1 glycosyltransferase family A protein [Bryobacteraceae bacterium]